MLAKENVVFNTKYTLKNWVNWYVYSFGFYSIEQKNELSEYYGLSVVNYLITN